MVKDSNKRLIITINKDLYNLLYYYSGRENGYNMSKFCCDAISYYIGLLSDNKKED